MSRALAGLDRTVVLVLGLLLVGVGVLAVVWQRGLVDRLDGTISAPGLTTAAESSWWPWAVGAAGVLLVLVALRWLVAHLAGRSGTRVRLPGSDRSGRLTADLAAVATAAAESVLGTPGVRACNGRAVDDRGRRTVQLMVTLDPTADLPPVVAAAERACGEVGQALPDGSLAARVHLRVARTSKVARSA